MVPIYCAEVYASLHAFLPTGLAAMSSSWSDVPYLFCHLRLDVSHQFRKRNAEEGPEGNVFSHSTEFVVAGTFRLRREDGEVRPFFVNEKVTLQVSGWSSAGMSGGSGEGAWESGHRMAFSGRTGPGAITLELYPDDKYVASLASRGDQAFTFKAPIHAWLRGPGNLQETHGEEEGTISILLQQPFPAQAGEVRFQAKPSAIMLSTPFCPGTTACEDPQVSGTLRLTPGVPALRIVDDTMDQNPIPHCRVRVLCPDGVTREFVADEAGEVFIPRSGEDVHTLVEVLQDSAPLSAAQPGPWHVDVTPDLP
jgi:hypothetical protein